MSKQQEPSVHPIITADFSIIPLGIGTSVGDYLHKAYLAMKQVKGALLHPTGMSTVIEAPDLQTIWQVVEEARRALSEAGVQRMYMIVKIDERRDTPHPVNYKLARMTGEEKIDK
jgi:uncharacterized protein (TIGR00106 family)